MKNLKQLSQDYKSKKIEKHDYIKEMHLKHQSLFDYFDYIKDTDINSIAIDNEKILGHIIEQNNPPLINEYRAIVPSVKSPNSIDNTPSNPNINKVLDGFSWPKKNPPINSKMLHP